VAVTVVSASPLSSQDFGWSELPSASIDPEPYQLVWWDDFEGDSLDLKKWYHLVDCSGRGNNELQCYTNRTENVRVSNGILELIARPEKYEERDYTSGRVHSSGQGWTYGFFEARARLPRGKHLWPAIWMVPSSGVYGPWPMSGEIDIMEARGQDTYRMESTIHYGAARTDRSKIGTSMMDFPFDLSDDFHVFGFEWNNSSMSWYFDGIKYFQVPTDKWFITDKGSRVYSHPGAPFDQNFKWILNVAVGGGYFPKTTYGDISWEEAVNWEKPFMEVDWVRVFQKNINPYLTAKQVETTTASFKPTSSENPHQTSLNPTHDTFTPTVIPIYSDSDTTTLPTTSTTSDETTTFKSLGEHDLKKDEDKKIKDSSAVDPKKGNEVVFYDYDTLVEEEVEPSTTYYYDFL